MSQRAPHLNVVQMTPAPERFPYAVPVSTIHPERVRFIWDGRLAEGKITVIDGDPGLGKSTLTLELAAKISTGDALFGGDRRLPRGAMILSAEDGEADTIRPRLEAAGADLRKVFIFKMRDDEGNEHQAVIPDDLQSLERQIEATNTGLVIIDPFVAFLNGEKNANRDQDVRGAMSPLASMAERTGCAIVVLRHLNKSLGSSPLYRGGGSIGIIGAARFGFIVAKDPEDPTGLRRIIAPQKINIGPEPPPLAYHLVSVPGTDVAKIEWLGEAAISTAALLDNVQSDYERTARTESRSWLSDALSDGPVAVKDLQDMARKDGISWRTLERSKHDLGIIARRDGFGKGGKFVWAFPLTAKGASSMRASASSDRRGYSAEATSMADDWPGE